MPKKKEFQLTPYQQKFLQTQEISFEEPGTILRDFQSLLEYIGDEGVPVTGSQNLFSMKLLPEINECLCHPLNIELKRPQQKSYPHINGLYLLLRTTGIGYIVKIGKKPFLALDETLLHSWQNLSMTERYFSLLQAWWCRGNEEILGEQRGRINDFMFRCMDFFTKISNEGTKIDNTPGAQEHLRYYPGLHNIALMEMFGFITIQSSSGGGKWLLRKITSSIWGDVLLGSFFEIAQRSFDIHFFDDQMAENSELDFQEWSSLITPFFEDWNDLLKASEHEVQNGIHIFKISLGKAWRRIAISGKEPLISLAEAILDAFDFDDDHLHRFSYKDRYGITREVDHSDLEVADNPVTNEVCIGELPLFVGMDMLFIFDFGDYWEFEIEVKDTDAQYTEQQKPTVIESRVIRPI